MTESNYFADEYQRGIEDAISVFEDVLENHLDNSDQLTLIMNDVKEQLNINNI